MKKFLFLFISLSICSWSAQSLYEENKENIKKEEKKEKKEGISYKYFSEKCNENDLDPWEETLRISSEGDRIILNAIKNYGVHLAGETVLTLFAIIKKEPATLALDAALLSVTCTSIYNELKEAFKIYKNVGELRNALLKNEIKPSERFRYGYDYANGSKENDDVSPMDWALKD